jgi:hypothetical protein
MKTLLYWIIPVVKNVKAIYDNAPQDDTNISDISLSSSNKYITNPHESIYTKGNNSIFYIIFFSFIILMNIPSATLAAK